MDYDTNQVLFVQQSCLIGRINIIVFCFPVCFVVCASANLYCYWLLSMFYAQV